MSIQSEVRPQLRVSARETLAEARAALDGAITATSGNKLLWAGDLQTATQQLIRAIQEHAESAERPEGTLALIAQRAPRLLSKVRSQEVEHAILLGEASLLDGEIRRQIAGGIVGPSALRERATLMLDRVRMHIARASDLIYEAFYSDIGGES